MLIVRPGTGEPAGPTDTITYRVDFYWHRKEPSERSEQTQRVADLMPNSAWYADLREMRAGERRSVWGRQQNGNNCDHFGCSPGPEPYTAVVELLAIERDGAWHMLVDAG